MNAELARGLALIAFGAALLLWSHGRLRPPEGWSQLWQSATAFTRATAVGVMVSAVGLALTWGGVAWILYAFSLI